VITYALNPDPEITNGRLLITYADGKPLLVDSQTGKITPNTGTYTKEMDLYKDRLTWFLTGNPAEGSALNDYNPYKVSTIAVWNRTLTPEEVAALGGVSK
jgi:hypothetical protein